MIGSIDTSADTEDLSEGIADRRFIEPGPLFKEIYSGLMDMENPEEWRPLLQREVRSFFAHTTDIQYTRSIQNNSSNSAEMWNSFSS